MAETIKIGGELESNATGNKVVDVANVKDKTQEDKSQAQINTEINIALDARYLKTETYNQTQLDSMITTPEIEYKDYDTYADMIAETDHPNGAIYRVANYNGTQAVTNKYAEYSWNGTQYKLMAVRDHGIDDEPTAGSEKLVKSSGIFKNMQLIKSIYGDIDFSISDENDMSIVAFKDGHIKTKNFDSKELNIKTQNSNNITDFSISDENNKVICLFKDGHIKTKNFDSKKIYKIKNINQTFIPATLSKLSKILNQKNVVLNLGMIGDSWTQGVGSDPAYTMNRITYVKFLTRMLWEKYGYAGLGWFDFGYSNSDMKCADDTCISLSKSGDISYITRTPESLGIACSHAIFSSGSSYTLTLIDNNRPIDKAVIWFYNDAQFNYEINDDGNPLQVVADSNSGWQNVTINSNITKIKITATSNNTIIFGIDFSYGTKGIKVHKLGNRAATSTDFVEVNADNWKQGISKLNLDCLSETLFTNDRWIDNVSPIVVIENLNELFNRFKDVQPYSDVICIAPADNYHPGNYNYSTKAYAEAVFEFCLKNNYPFINLGPLFGTKEQIQTLGLFYDNLHPNLDGDVLIASNLYKELFNIND